MIASQKRTDERLLLLEMSMKPKGPRPRPAFQKITEDESQTEQNKPKSWAETAAAAKHLPQPAKTPAGIKRAARNMFSVRKPAAEFQRIHLRIQDTRFLSKLPKKQHQKAIRESLKGLGINSKVCRVSRIGKSILELYIVQAEMDNIKNKLKEKKVEIIENLDLLASPANGLLTTADSEGQVVKRLGFLYKNAPFQKLKEAILAGLPGSVVARIQAFASQIPNVDAPASGGNLFVPANQEGRPKDQDHVMEC
jgi:hypothetical protein